MRQIARKDLFASVVEEGQEQEFLSYDFKTHAEIAYFSQSRVLDGDWKKEAKVIRELLERKHLDCSLHGPFYEMHYQTKDKDIQAVVRKRFSQILEVAEFMKAGTVILHSTYNPLNAQADNMDKWVNASAEFLKPIASRAEQLGVMLALENIYDDKPEPIKKLITAVASPSLKACIDMGHWFLFSKMPISHWVNIYGDDLVYFHLHDNNRQYDDHDAIGSGQMPFRELFEALEASPARPKYSIEVRTFGLIDKSLEYMRAQNWLVE